MQAKNGSLVATILICTILLAGFSYMTRPVIPEVSSTDIAAAVLAGISIPTAEEIGANINVNVDTSKTDDLWDVMFGGCTRTLENAAESDVMSEIDMDDLKDFIEDSIEDFDRFVSNPAIDDDETEVEVVALGQCTIYSTEFGEDDEDKSAEVTLVYDFKYEDETDNTEHKGSVTVTGTVVYDEGDFSDEDVELSYVLN